MIASSSDSGVLQLYSAYTGDTVKTFYSKEFGCRAIKFTHHENAVLFAGSKDGAVRYYSFHDNVILHTFEGHTRPVTSIDMHPTRDEFITCSEDGTFRVWDLDTKQCKGVGDYSAHRGMGTITAAYNEDGTPHTLHSALLQDTPFNAVPCT
jgi:WD40 repeat protein